MTQNIERIKALKLGEQYRAHQLDIAKSFNFEVEMTKSQAEIIKLLDAGIIGISYSLIMHDREYWTLRKVENAYKSIISALTFM